MAAADEITDHMTDIARALRELPATPEAEALRMACVALFYLLRQYGLVKPLDWEVSPK